LHIKGLKLGRPKESLSKETKFFGKKEQIRELLSKKVSHSIIAHIFGINQLTVKQFVESRVLLQMISY